MRENDTPSIEEAEVDNEMLADPEMVRENGDKAYDAALVTIIYKFMPVQGNKREVITCVKTGEYGPYFQLISEADLGELPPKVQALLAKLKLEMATNPVKPKPATEQTQKDYVAPLKRAANKVEQPSLPVELSTELPAIPATNKPTAAKPIVTTQPTPTATKPKPKTPATAEQGSLFDLI
jgi:hypothetical protein